MYVRDMGKEYFTRLYSEFIVIETNLYEYLSKPDTQSLPEASEPDWQRAERYPHQLDNSVSLRRQLTPLEFID